MNGSVGIDRPKPRDAHGHFAKGNPGSPGRAPRTTEAAYLQAVAAACPPPKWKKVVERAVQDAIDGDARARDWLSHYLIGKPREAMPEAIGGNPITVSAPAEAASMEAWLAAAAAKAV